MKSISSKRLNYIILALLLPIFYSCDKGNSDNDIPSLINDANWTSTSTVKATSGSSGIAITGPVGSKWAANILDGTTWCSFDAKGTLESSISGEIKDGLNILYIYYPANATRATRTANISIQFDDQNSKTLTLTQLSESEQDLPAFGLWAEIPVYKENSTYQYLTHYVTLDKKTVRNYSMCFDNTKKAALWVAYPLHAAYKGNIGRTEEWGYDPLIPENYQAIGYYKGYQRGHQIASADRQATYEMNAQTYYMSNMTPQLGALNGDMWAKLEAKVRTNTCLDTLYVVTGAIFGNGYKTTTDGSGQTVPVPINYFKVLLRTTKGNSGKSIKECSESELSSIGFWVEQKSYGDIQPPKSICTTVADIEAKTGFTFFPQVSSNVKEQNDPYFWGIN